MSITRSDALANLPNYVSWQENLLTGQLIFVIKGRDEQLCVVVDADIPMRYDPWELHAFVLEHVKVLRAREAILDAVTAKLMS